MALLGTLTSSVSALDSFTTGLDAIGNNIANINSTAFKGSTVSFSDTFTGVGTQVNSTSESFSQGALSSTGNATDLGVSGNGFFIVRDPNGTGTIEYATRDDDNGYLVNQEGYRVQGLTGGTGAAAPATLGDIKEATPPTGAQLSGVAIDASGNVTETYSDGTTLTSNQVLLQNFTDPNLLQAQGNNLYTNMAGAGPLTTTLGATNAPGQGGLGNVESGSLEQSNVDLTTQFSNMITLQRAFEANARMITISDTILEDVVNMKTH